jgi:general secretion pathway protein L
MSGTGISILSRASGSARELLSHLIQEWREILSERKAHFLSLLPLPTISLEGRATTFDGRALNEPLPLPGSTVSLVLPESDVLRPRLCLPTTSRRILEKALPFELRRISPVNPADVYFDFRISGTEYRTADVDLRVVRKQTVDDVLAMCGPSFLKVAEIRLGDDLEAADWRRFPVDRKALLAAQWDRWRVAALAVLAMILSLLLLLAIYARGNATLAGLQQEIAAAQTGADHSNRLRMALLSTAEIPSLLSRQKSEPSTTTILAEITQLLPDDTWLTALEISGRKLRLQGFSRSASHILPRLDDSHLLANARFEAPLTQETAGSAQRFDIAAEIAR